MLLCCFWRLVFLGFIDGRYTATLLTEKLTTQLGE